MGRPRGWAAAAAGRPPAASRGHRVPYCRPVTGSVHPHRRNTDPTPIMTALPIPHRVNHEIAFSMRLGKRRGEDHGANKAADQDMLPLGVPHIAGRAA